MIQVEPFSIRHSLIAMVASLALGASLTVAPESASAHGGGLDANGCHNSSATGRYHCHSGSRAGASFPSKSAFLSNKAPDPIAQHAGGDSASDDGAYDRDDYHTRWLDRDDDCQDTREEVLIRQSRKPVEFASDQRCDVVAGRWVDPYSGQVFTDPGKLDIDHLVPLVEAHQSGAANWSEQRRHSYANDLQTRGALIAVAAGENRSKGGDDPADWMPSNEAFHCAYVELWVDVKDRWSLSMDPDERDFLNQQLAQCERQH